MGTGATLKVGASNSEFNKAMRDMATQMKTVKSEFNLASTQAKLFGSATDQLKAKQSELTNKVKIQNDMLKNQENQTKTLTQNIDKQKSKQTELSSKIEETNKKYKESVQATGKNSEESKKLKGELDGLKIEYAKNDKAIDSNNRKLENAVIKMNGTKASLLENEKALGDINQKLSNVKIDEFAGKMDKVSKKSGEMADKMKPASTAILGVGVASATASTVFEDSMAKVFTIADETEVSYDDMKKAIMDLSSQTGISANDIADNVYNAISAGQKTGDAVNFVNNATKLAKAGFAESSDTLNILTTALNAYGLESSEATDISNKLIVAQNEGKTTVAELSSSMGAVIPIAKGANINMSELSTSYAVMTKNGIATAESGTMLKAMFGELTKSGSLTDKALRELSGKGFADLKAEGKGTTEILGMIDQYAQANGKSIKDMFGSVEAGTASITLLTQDGEEFNDILGKMNDSAGATDKAFETMSNTTGNTFKKSMNDIKISAISMGDVLAPITSSISNGLKNVTTWLSSLSEGQLKIVASIGGIIVGATGLLMLVSKVTGAIGTISTGISKIPNAMEEIGKAWTKLKPIGIAIKAFAMANPVVLIATVVIGLLVLMYTKCEWFRNGVNAIGNWLKNFFTVTLPNAFKVVVSFFQNDWKEILLFIVNPFAGAFALLYKHNDKFREKVNGFITAVKNLFVNGFNSVVNFFKGLPAKATVLWTRIKTAFTTGWNAVAIFFTTTIPAWISSIGTWFAELPNKIMYGLGALIGLLGTWGVEVWNYFSTNVPLWINNVVTFFSELPGKIWDFLVEVVTKLGEWGANVISWIATNVVTWITNIVNFYAELPGKIWTFLVSVVTKLGEWGNNIISWITTTVPTWIEGIVKFFTELPDKIWSWLVNVVTKVTEWGSNMLTTAKEGMGKVFDGIVDIFKNLPSKMLDIGRNIVLGIKDGIKNAWDGMTGWLGGLCDSFTQGVKDKFEIHSPSHIFRDEIGKMLALGIGVGFENEMPNINADVNRTLDGTIDIANTEALKDMNKTYSINNKTDYTNIFNKVLYKLDELENSFNVILNIDGRQVAKATSKYMDEELAFNSSRR
ncbi:phage tail tape measure protein [Clostridium botulinum]|uniref:phage tail tape measure protein n=1 Tax=Clostridium botulinum TaxID=1491 RepID=UPI0007743D50|nr:phage tail tape measure protein [Clostridium botulinum]NFL87350.1 phage tail tape measure protein [Clostridium botulinum]NFO21687.1 phage tail tape measure protein [Clostridium botulinum]